MAIDAVLPLPREGEGLPISKRDGDARRPLQQAITANELQGQATEAMLST